MDFETRLVDSILDIEFGLLDISMDSKVKQEYSELTQLHNNSIEKWLHSIYAKSGECKCGASNAILGEMLVFIFKKLEHIENLITGESKHYVALEYKAKTARLGHGVIILDSKILSAECRYYARLNLPIFPVRCLPLFCVARECDVLEIERISERDLKDYDSYIVSVEREMLKARRQQKL